MQTHRPGRVARALAALVTLAIIAVPAEAVAAKKKPAAPTRPGVPALVQPSNGASFQFLPAFQWKRAARAATYEFELAADSGFNSPVLGAGKDSFTTRNLRGTLPEAVSNGTYYWRVRALDAAGEPSKWSRGRKVVRAWSAAPTLQSPVGGDVISYPAETLTLSWAPVDYAATYEVKIATDPKLSSLVALEAGTPKAIPTGATALTPGTTLAAGTYYWAVTPIDARGHKGASSKVSSFRWEWPSATTAAIADLAGEPEVDAYRFSWLPVPGASRYEVEINSSADFGVGSEVCCADATTGLSLTPKAAFANNAYYWRVRPVDIAGNAGQWSRGPDFTKSFDIVTPSITNLHLRNHLGEQTATGGVTKSPIVTWNPVPGASSYQVQVAAWNDAVCLYGSFEGWNVKTATNAWTPLGHGSSNNVPVPNTNVTVNSDGSKELINGGKYCVRVRAIADRDSAFQEVVGTFTDLQISPAQPWAFEFDWSVNFGAPAGSGSPGYLGASDYLEPQTGVTSSRMPVFTWKPVRAPGGTAAQSYWVIVARDAQFTKLVDYAFTQIPAYAPRGSTTAYTYADEQSFYYWAVLPSSQEDGSAAATSLALASARSFLKLSNPPVPGGIIEQNGQPSFVWSLAEGARNYTLQISQDPSFANPLETVKTVGLSYTTSLSYPADTLLYWRVRANDERDIGLTWSSVSTFRRSLPTPTASASNALKGDSIPTWRWNLVPGAVGYDMLVEEPDGDQTAANGMRQAALTATKMTGTGKFRWQVRALFPTTGSSSTPGPWGAFTEFTRTIGEPVGARSVIKAGQVLMSWNAKSGAKHYTVQVSDQKSFKTTIENIKVDGTQFAPTLVAPGWLVGGPLWWRVAAIDADGNTGAYSGRRLKLSKGMDVTVTASLVARTAGEVKVTVKWKRKALRNATVKLSGPGVSTRRVLTNRKGEATLRATPAKAGVTLEVRVTKSGYQLNRVKVDVR